jgi:hypothetical protein
VGASPRIPPWRDRRVECMRRAALTTLLAASAILLTGCVTVVVPDNDRDDDAARVEQLDNRTDVGCSPDEELLLNNPSTLYTVTGDCDEIVIEGTDLVVRIESADSVVIRGDRNLVEATSIDEVEISGQDNTVKADEIDDVEIAGDRNTVESAKKIDDMDIDASGNDNVVR